ncbi:hypothetical protein ACLOJK_018835, partial [Asimina triloba]
MYTGIRYTTGAPKSGAPSSPHGSSMAALSQPTSGHQQMRRPAVFSSNVHLQTPTVDSQWPTQSTASDLAADDPRNPSKIQAPASVQGWPIHELPQKSASKRAGHEQSSSLHPAPIRSSRCSSRQHQWPSAITPKSQPAADNKKKTQITARIGSIQDLTGSIHHRPASPIRMQIGSRDPKSSGLPGSQPNSTAPFRSKTTAPSGSLGAEPILTQIGIYHDLQYRAASRMHQSNARACSKAWLNQDAANRQATKRDRRPSVRG